MGTTPLADTYKVNWDALVDTGNRRMCIGIVV
jgi:hypothetical protein